MYHIFRYLRVGVRLFLALFFPTSHRLNGKVGYKPQHHDFDFVWQREDHW